MKSTDRTRTVCQLLYYAIMASLFLIPLMLVVVWCYADSILMANQMIPTAAISFPLSNSSRLFLVLMTALVAAPTYWGLFALRRFLKACCAEEYLSSDNSRYLKRFAFGLIGSALLSPVSSAVLSVLLTMHNPPGQRMLAIGLGSHQLMLAAIGVLLFILANLLKRASLIAEENAQII